jgi:hypothetical protein
MAPARKESPMMAVNQERADARRSSLDGETEGRPGAGRTAGLLMSLAAVTLGAASYLHRDGRIPLGFTVINGERFYAASVPEAVIAFALAIGAISALMQPHLARLVAWGATIFAILGVAYGLSDTIGTGRAADITYHSALMTLLLATGIVLWTGRPSTNRNLE